LLIAACLCAVASPARAEGTLRARLERAMRSGSTDERLAALRAVVPEGLPEDPLERSRLIDRVGKALTGAGTPEVRIAAARALWRSAEPGGFRPAANAASEDGQPDVAEAAARAMGRCAASGEVKRLLVMCGAAQVRARIVAALALGETADPRGKPALRRVLERDGEPSVRAAAALALGRVAAADDLAFLLRRKELESDVEVEAACVEALEEATGAQSGWNVDAWNRLKAAGKLVRRPAGTETTTPRRPGHSVPAETLTRWTVSYWGIPLDQDGVLFCVDRSASMNFYDRLPDARRELAATVGRLPSSVRFNVTFFNDSMHWWQDRLVQAGPLAKYRLKQALPELEAKRYTDLLGLLKNVFRFEQGLSERPASAGRLKTVFLLTDGLPSKQFITDGEVIRAHVAQWNPGKRVTVHAIGLGMSDEQFLIDLAEANGGKAVFKGRRK
jgi:hypothetical protein